MILPWALLYLIRREALKRGTLAGLKPYKGPVTAEMTAWAKSIVDDPTTFPMGATVARVFGELLITARVEQHTWTHRDGKLVRGKFRGVTLYEVA